MSKNKSNSHWGLLVVAVLVVVVVVACSVYVL